MVKFRWVLLSTCQDEFEVNRSRHGSGPSAEAIAAETPLETVRVKMILHYMQLNLSIFLCVCCVLIQAQREHADMKRRKRMLGNMRFIGELGKKNMLAERIIHQCLNLLLRDATNPHPDDMEVCFKRKNKKFIFNNNHINHNNRQCVC